MSYFHTGLFVKNFDVNTVGWVLVMSVWEKIIQLKTRVRIQIMYNFSSIQDDISFSSSFHTKYFETLSSLPVVLFVVVVEMDLTSEVLLNCF